VKLNEALARPATSIDIGYSSLKLLAGDRGLELPIERSETGELTAGTRERLAREIRAFLAGGGFSRRALCGVPARGVSLRRFSLPPAPREEIGRLVALQLEREFPLSPEELAWGFAAQSRNGTAPPGAPPGQEVTVAALRRQVLDSYSELLSSSGLKPVFTLGVLAGSSLCPQPGGEYSVLDIGRTQSELVSFESGHPRSVRSLAWGGEAVTRAIAAALGVTLAESEEVKRSAGAAAGGDAPDRGEAQESIRAAIQAAIQEELAELASQLRAAFPSHRPNGDGQGFSAPSLSGNGAAPTPRPLFLLGGGSRLAGLSGEIERLLEGRVTCRRIEVGEGASSAGAGSGRSAVTLGLLRESGPGTRNGSLQFLPPERIREWRPGASPRAARKWLAAALGLAVASIALRYLSPVFHLPGLRARLTDARAARAAAPGVDRELAFLEHLASRQAPYLDVLATMAEAAPPGLLLSEFTMTQKGELSLQGQLGSLADAGTFRARLTESGRFSQVVIEELTPIKDNRAQLRLSALLRPPGSPLPPATPPSTAPSPTAPPPGAQPAGAAAPGGTSTPPAPPPEALTGTAPAPPASPGGPPPGASAPTPSAPAASPGGPAPPPVAPGSGPGSAPPGAAAAVLETSAPTASAAEASAAAASESAARAASTPSPAAAGSGVEAKK
jgi:Tfp pilus assembly PilM family ATPase